MHCFQSGKSSSGSQPAFRRGFDGRSRRESVVRRASISAAQIGVGLRNTDLWGDYGFSKSLPFRAILCHQRTLMLRSESRSRPVNLGGDSIRSDREACCTLEWRGRAMLRERGAIGMGS
jgi:hypothetical protein